MIINQRCSMFRKICTPCLQSCSGNFPCTTQLYTTARLLLYCCAHFFRWRRINLFPSCTSWTSKKPLFSKFWIIFFRHGTHRINPFFHTLECLELLEIIFHWDSGELLRRAIEKIRVPSISVTITMNRVPYFVPYRYFHLYFLMLTVSYDAKI